MQFKSIIVVLSLALAATAVPTGQPTKAPPPPPKTGPICKPNQTASECYTLNKDGSTNTGISGLLGVLGLVLKVGDILKCDPIIPIASGNNQQANACCDTSGVQNGVINVGTICAPIQA